jgi:hypothetical protein
LVCLKALQQLEIFATPAQKASNIPPTVATGVGNPITVIMSPIITMLNKETFKAVLINEDILGWVLNQC